jgi:hypothetical protein
VAPKDATLDLKSPSRHGESGQPVAAMALAQGNTLSKQSSTHVRGQSNPKESSASIAKQQAVAQPIPEKQEELVQQQTTLGDNSTLQDGGRSSVEDNSQGMPRMPVPLAGQYPDSSQPMSPQDAMTAQAAQQHLT